MSNNKFLKWVKWKDRKSLPDLEFPGIYCIAISIISLAEKHFEWIEKIRYIGRTISNGGLKQRLDQFDSEISKGKGKTHGGADRMRYKNQNYNTLSKKLYVSVTSFKCDTKSLDPKDYLIKGEVLKHEYVCLAEYIKRFGHLPKFNDQSNSPKYSKM